MQEWRSFFTIFAQNKNANVANFILAVPREMKQSNGICNSNSTFTNIMIVK